MITGIKNKIAVVGFGILLAAVVFFCIDYNLTKKDNKALKIENKALTADVKQLQATIETQKAEVKRYNERQNEASTIIAQLRKEAKRNKDTDPENCDCYNLRIDSGLIDLLPKP